MDTSGVGNPLRSSVLKDRLGSAHIVKVRVQHGHNRPIGHLAQFGDCFAHFFGRFTRINGDNPLGAFNKGLIRQSVSDQRPHTLTNFIKLAPQNLGLFGMFHVCDLPARKCDCLRIIGGKRSLKIPARRLCHSRTLDRFVFMRNPARSPLFFPFFGIF